MRRLTLAAIAAVMGLSILAGPASARIDHHFSVDIRHAEFRGDETNFRLRAPLFATFNRENQVGRLQVHCRQGPEKARCKGLIHLNGDVGGFGFIYVNGNLGGGDDRLNIVGGTDDFEGAAGKILAPRNRLHVDVVR